MKELYIVSVMASVAGLIMLFLYGISPFEKAGSVYLFNKEEMPGIEKRERSRKLKRNIGYALCIAGLLLQLIVYLA